jgi:hypothetical protein
MSAQDLPPDEPSPEIAALIETLHQTEQRLEELTRGEVDTVANHFGRTTLLRRAQVQLRASEAVKQAAILDALPAHIALLDPQGRIVSVNHAWRQFRAHTPFRALPAVSAATTSPLATQRWESSNPRHTRSLTASAPCSVARSRGIPWNTPVPWQLSRAGSC